MSHRFECRALGFALALAAALTLSVGCGGGGSSKKKKGGNQGQPTVSDVLPNAGSVGGGDTITILTMGFTDDFMVNPPIVTFGGVPATNVTGVTPNNVTCTNPSNPAGSVDVVVTGSLTTSDTDTLPNGFTYTSNVSVTSVTPNSGDVGGAELVVITTANYADDFTVNRPNVTFGTISAQNVLPVNASTIQAVTPPQAAGTVDVTVDSTGVVESATLANAYTYVVTPPPQCIITAVTPNNGAEAGGNAVFIQGTDFDVPPVSILFGTNMAQILQQPSSSVIQVIVPAGTGVVDVTVNNATLSCTLVGGYTYNAPPPPVCNIAAVSPNSGGEAGGNTVTITGTGFDALPSNNAVSFDGNPATVLGGTTTSLDVTVPPGNAGMVDVFVDVNGMWNCTLPGGYTYIGCQGGPGCNIASITPNTEIVGAMVQIDGTGFQTGALVYFDNDPSPNVDDSQAAAGILLAEVPAPSGAQATVDVQIVNPNGDCCTSNNGFTYIGCTLNSVTPNVGPGSGGQIVTISGAFDPGPTPVVMFGGAQANVASNDGSDILVTTPPGVGGATVDVTVLDNAGDFCILASAYTYTDCGITSMTPTVDGTNGGEFFIITGGPFDPSVFVTFGNIFADPNSVSVDPTGTMIFGVVPPQQFGGTVQVTVDNIVSRTTCSTPFDYVLPGGNSCSITAINPGQGAIGGGDLVTITGTGFDANTGIVFDVVPATSINFIDANTIECVTPPFGGQLQQMVTVDVIVAPEFSNPCTSTFDYVQASCPGGCAITSITPDNGPLAGGTMITINGTGFCANGPQVLIDALPATNVTYVSDTQITCVTPAGNSVGPKTVGYADGGGCVAIAPVMFTYN